MFCLQYIIYVTAYVSIYTLVLMAADRLVQGVFSPGADHRVHRVATAAFWRTFHQEGKISPGW
jgi:hypothetical protein